jgi:uncharacterized protein YggT (Ycf19 family)
MQRKENSMTELPPDQPVTRTTTTTTRTYNWHGYVISQADLRRITLLIQLAFGILNGLIGLRFILKLFAANPANAFAQLVYFITEPFLWLFRGLTATPGFGGVTIEFYDLIAIIVYTAISWVIVQLIWILFARLR